jgi:hypothetical protein
LYRTLKYARRDHRITTPRRLESFYASAIAWNALLAEGCLCVSGLCRRSHFGRNDPLPQRRESGLCDLEVRQAERN